jgi:ferric-dicitrate binding protein FerR (iron transport regulator)
MVAFDARLDARLQAFYEHIERQSPPRALASFEAPLGRSRRRSLNLLAGVAGIAVVVAGVSLFATELSSHRNSTPPTPAGRPPTPGACCQPPPS